MFKPECDHELIIYYISGKKKIKFCRKCKFEMKHKSGGSLVISSHGSFTILCQMIEESIKFKDLGCGLYKKM